MPAERFFYLHHFLENTIITIENEEFHHMTRVMRNQVGDQVELVNGLNQLAIASIDSMTKKSAELSIKKVFTSTPSSYGVLNQALLRLSKLEWIIEKAVELNVKEIRLYPAIYSEKVDLKETQFERLKILIQSAVKQSGRLDLPLLTLVPPIEKWERESCPCYFGDTSIDRVSLLTEDLSASSSAMFTVGPEQGFHEKEIKKLKELGYKGVSLGSNILRTETAAIAACTLLDYTKNYRAPI